MVKKFLVFILVFSLILLVGCKKNKNPTIEIESSSVIESSSEVSSVEESSSEASSSSEPVSSSKPSSSSKPTPSSKPAATTPAPVKPATDYEYNTNMDMNDNVFMDSLIYTGYNIQKHIADGEMWKYRLASTKRAKGWLSKIGYSGIPSGYEKTSDGKPNIDYFIKKGGLCCASYVTYVYFNYLPNVAGIDTSFLDKPSSSVWADDWYKAAKKWVEKGYSKSIKFTATKDGSGFIRIKPEQEIPIGSIIVMCNAKNKRDVGSHVSVYAGYKNGYNWVYHVGNDNGPEFCSIERMYFGPDPQWPLAIITTPSNIRMAACLEVSLNDNNGKAISGVEFKAKNKKSGTEYKLGKTNAEGKISKEGLPFGDYTLTQTVPEGYTTESKTKEITLSVKNNGLTKISITNNLPAPAPSSSSSSTPASSSASASSSEAEVTQ